MRQLVCAIVGRRRAHQDSRDCVRYASLAAECAVNAGFAVLTGGREGAMYSAAHGAKRAGGFTIAILPENAHDAVEGDVYDLVLPTPIGIVRNVLTASACDVMIGVPGGSGTIEEMLFAQDFGRPVCQFPEWLESNRIVVPSVEDVEQLSRWLAAQRDVLQKRKVE